MNDIVPTGQADLNDSSRLRYSVSLVQQGKSQFYTLTIPSDVLARTCSVTTRATDKVAGFQRVLDADRAAEIAKYIDETGGTIPGSIVLSAQPEAGLKIVGKGKTLEFNDKPGAFLILDGQHRVYGFSKAKTKLRVPVVVYNGLSRAEETRLFIDINTKQRPVPTALLLDIKQLAETETETETTLREIFDIFSENSKSALYGMMSASDTARGKISRVTFNSAIKPILGLFAGKTTMEIYQIIDAYLQAVIAELPKKANREVLSRATPFKGVMGIFPLAAQRVADRYNREYKSENFRTILSPVFTNMQMKKFSDFGSSHKNLTDYLTERLTSKFVI